MSRILHFGPGNFFRAHLAEYTFDAGGWEITAVSLRSATFRDGLRAAGGAFTLAVQGAAARRIDVIRDVLVAPEEPEAVLAAIADPEVAVISATVTEKGYACSPGDGGSFIAMLARGLARREAPVTLLSCDNSAGNGDMFARALQAYCTETNTAIRCRYTVPNAMVDRITPATTDALRAEFDDPMAVPCEPFKEWVIEDVFAAARPDWPGVQWVSDVAPHEMRKLRMLNGAHSYLAYAGVLAGHEFVHQAIADPTLRAGARALMAEAAQTLPDAVRAEAGAYADALLARFENPHLAHALRQIAMDGTQKLPYRFLDTWRDRARQGLKSPAVLAGLRAWLAFCRAEVAAGQALQDPQADRLAAAQGDADLLALVCRDEAERAALVADLSPS